MSVFSKKNSRAVNMYLHICAILLSTQSEILYLIVGVKISKRNCVNAFIGIIESIVLIVGLKDMFIHIHTGYGLSVLIVVEMIINEIETDRNSF